jgi:hypothetical protein
MPNFAILNTLDIGYVSVVIIADTLEDAQKTHLNLTAIAIPAGVSVGAGYYYDGETFTPPTISDSQTTEATNA